MQQHIWKIEWDDSLSVGIPEIDADHKQFIVLVNRLNKAIIDRMELSEIKNRLQSILEDAVRHFEHEEGLFRQWNYHDVDAHARKHAEIVSTLRTIMGRVGSDTLMPQWIEVGLEIKDTLITHISTEDMKYAQFYRNSPELHRQ